MPKIIIEATTEEIAAMLRALLEPKPVAPFSSPTTTTSAGTGVLPATSASSSVLPQNSAEDRTTYYVNAEDLSLDTVNDMVQRFRAAPLSSTRPARRDKRTASKEEAKKIITYNELSDKQRKLIKILYMSDKPLSIDVVAKKMKAQRNSALATKGNLVKRAALALHMDHPPIFIDTPDGKNSMEITEDFRRALDELPVNISTDW